MESTNSEDFQALNIIAFALMGGLALFAAIVFYLISSGSQGEAEAIISPSMDLLLVGGVGLASLVMSRIVSTKILEGFPQEKRQDYQTALGAYRSGIIIRLALLEGAGLTACVFALITGNINLLLITGFMVVMMWTRRPTEAEFAEWRG